MALSRVGGSSAAATSIAIPAHVAGDVIVIWAYRDGSTTPPTKPAAGGTVPAWVTVDGPTGANANSAICAYFVATGTTETSGTWANATGMSVEVWRGADANPLGGHAQSGGSAASGANMSVPAITPTDPTGASVYLSFAGHQNVTAWSAPPAGYTQRSNVATECEAVTKDTTTSDGSFNLTCTASGTGGYRTQQLELIASFGNRVSQETAEVIYSTSAAKARVSQVAVEVLLQQLNQLDFISSVTALFTPQIVYDGSIQIVVTTPGTYYWLCPPGVTSVYVECFGGAGRGGTGSPGTARAGNGGGGGAYARSVAVPVTPGTIYTFVVGAGGQVSLGTAATDSSFVGDSGAQVVAKAGDAGGNTSSPVAHGGASASSTGDVKFSGGDGGIGSGSGNLNSGAGGASGNFSADGNAGTNGTSGSPGVGGAGANGGGSGANGVTQSLNGVAGTAPGGAGSGGGGLGSARPGGAGADGKVTISPGLVLGFISSVTQVYVPRLPLPLPFKASTTVVYALNVQGYVSVPFIGSNTAVHAPALQDPNLPVPFISSVTAVYTPTLVGAELDLPFISSSTVVHAPTLIFYLNLPFISTRTRVWAIMSLFDPDKLYAGQGNGGEGFLIRLNANGVTDTATLANNIGTGTGAILSLTGDRAFPTTHPFIVTIDDEQIYVSQISPGHYFVRARARGNTTVASHTAGATVSWGDSYDQALVATAQINNNFSANINSTGMVTYPGWLVCFDSSQAYLDDGTRYPMHVTEVVGVFDAGAGVTGSNRLDGSQPNAISTPTGASDDCPAALANPARIQTTIMIGDVAVIRYTNPEAVVLDLGPRSASLQSWFGLKRVDLTDHDVTFTDPNGIVVDTTGTYDTFTGSVNGEWDPAPIVTGIAPAASDADPANAPIATPNPVPWTTVTLPGTDRKFTFGSGGGDYNENGWPMCCLCVRQGRKRVPFWQSWDWHDFSYVYSGFATDATYAQILINRNGVLYNSVPAVELPGPQDIDGPDAVWDDADYAFGASWYVVIYNTPYLVGGPVIGGTTIIIGGPSTSGIPSVSFGGGTPSVGGNPTQDPIEGGSGGNIGGSEGLHVWQTS